MADSNRNVVTPIRIRSGARDPGGFTLHSGSPARCEQAGDSRGRRNRIPRQCTATRFPTGASHLAGSSSIPRTQSSRILEFEYHSVLKYIYAIGRTRKQEVPPVRNFLHYKLAPETMQSVQVLPCRTGVLRQMRKEGWALP